MGAEEALQFEGVNLNASLGERFVEALAAHLRMPAVHLKDGVLLSFPNGLVTPISMEMMAEPGTQKAHTGTASTPGSPLRQRAIARSASGISE